MIRGTCVSNPKESGEFEGILHYRSQYDLVRARVGCTVLVAAAPPHCRVERTPRILVRLDLNLIVGEYLYNHFPIAKRAN